MTGRDSGDVWVLLGPHKGDNVQVLALAEALGLPFRIIQMRYKWFAHFSALLRQATIAQLDLASCREIAPPWPSLVLGIGQRSAPVARYIQRASGGRTRTVRLGDPMVSHELFDLVITTTQYAVRDAGNVVRLPITLTSQEDIRPNPQEQHWFGSFASPRRLMVIGGKTSLWRVDANVITKAAKVLRRRAEAEGGSVIAVTSPRTSASLLAAARAALGEGAVVNRCFPRYAALLREADEIHVTGDSVSMLSDAIASGKPVGLISLEPDLTARLVRVLGSVPGRPFRIRDLARFWSDLRMRGLVGTIEHPRSGSLDAAPIDVAVAAVRAVLRQGHEIVDNPRSSALPSQSVPEPLAL